MFSGNRNAIFEIKKKNKKQKSTLTLIEKNKEVKYQHPKTIPKLHDFTDKFYQYSNKSFQLYLLVPDPTEKRLASCFSRTGAFGFVSQRWSPRQ